MRSQVRVLLSPPTTPETQVSGFFMQNWSLSLLKWQIVHRKINSIAVLLVEEPLADTRRWQGHPTCCPHQQFSAAKLPLHFVLELVPVTSGVSLLWVNSLAPLLRSHCSLRVLLSPPTTLKHKFQGFLWKIYGEVCFGGDNMAWNNALLDLEMLICLFYVYLLTKGWKLVII